MDRGRKKIIIPIVLVITLFVLIAAGTYFFYEEPITEVSETREMMGTFVTVTVYAKEDEGKAAIEAAYDRMDEIIAIASRFNESAEVYRLNAQGYIDDPSPELIEMIELSIDYWEITNGSFDITILPLLNLWQYRFGTSAYHVFDIDTSHQTDLDAGNLSPTLWYIFNASGYPLEDSAAVEVDTPGGWWVVHNSTNESWREYNIINDSGDLGMYAQFWSLNRADQDVYIIDAQQYVGSDKITVTSNKITLQPGMSITLDGIAKGYIVDEGIEVLKEKGIKHALIDAGGDIGTLGSKPDDKWVIGLTNPENTEETLTSFKVSGKAVTTSGNYVRYFNESAEVGHIMDPATGRSVYKCSSATIIADNCTVADILATGIFVMGPEDGMTLVESLPNTEALIIDYDDPSILYRSSGLDEYEIEA